MATATAEVMAEIHSKRQFFSLWEQGLLGNHTLLWRSVDDAYRSGVPRIGFRQLNTLKGAKGAWTLVTRDHAHATAREWAARGYEFIMDGSVPNDRSVMQGEIVRTVRGMEGYLCERASLIGLTEPGLPPMRITMERGWHQALGYLETRRMVRRYLDPSSQNDLDALLELYPDAAIELTAFDCNVGVFPGRNTLFWEVRNY